jgi:hypothetical protein
MALHGKKEYRIKPGHEGKVKAWISKMEAEYRKDGFRIISHEGPASYNGYPYDNSVGGIFETLTAEIHIFHAEQNVLAYKAEELAHYLQCKRDGLIGKRESEIGHERIDELESEIIETMKSNGFEELR